MTFLEIDRLLNTSKLPDLNVVKHNKELIL